MKYQTDSSISWPKSAGESLSECVSLFRTISMNSHCIISIKYITRSTIQRLNQQIRSKNARLFSLSEVSVIKVCLWLSIGRIVARQNSEKIRKRHKVASSSFEHPGCKSRFLREKGGWTEEAAQYTCL